MKKSIILTIAFGWLYFSLYSQYHPDIHERDLTKLEERCVKLIAKSKCKGIKNYSKVLIIPFGEVGCEYFLDHKKNLLTKEVFTSGIQLVYETFNRKYLFGLLSKREKYLMATVYFLDDNFTLLGMYEGHSYIYCAQFNEKPAYTSTENFLKYLIDNEYTNIFSIGCISGMHYYAVNKNGEAEVIEFHKIGIKNYKPLKVASFPVK